MKRGSIALLVAGAVALGGCAHYPRFGHQPELFAQSYAEPYTLASGDRLRVIVFGQDSLSNSYAVDSTGHIAMPLIGSVPATGGTTKALERAVEAKLRNGFLREPRVSVEVEQYRPFFILGEVGQSGQYPYVNGMTVQTAVAIAGGFAPRANRWSVDLTRMINGEPVTGAMPIDTPIRPGDTITVRERFF
jgi:polysaccharide export outer membrane protein